MQRYLVTSYWAGMDGGGHGSYPNDPFTIDAENDVDAFITAGAILLEQSNNEDRTSGRPIAKDDVYTLITLTDDEEGYIYKIYPLGYKTPLLAGIAYHHTLNDDVITYKEYIKDWIEANPKFNIEETLKTGLH